MLCEILTDNRNRTAGEVRKIFELADGKLGAAGCVAWMFERKGLLLIPIEKIEEDRLMELALDAGAEDFKAEPEGYEIVTAPANLEEVHRQIETKGIKCAAAEVTWLPAVTAPISEHDASTVNRLIETLEEHDDVKEVYTNAEFSSGAGC